MTTEALQMAKEASGAVPLRSAAPTRYEVTRDTVAVILRNYEEDMAVNKSITIDDGVTHQMALLRAIKMILRLEGGDFINGWDMLLTWVATNLNGIMDVRRRNRFIDYGKRMPSRDRVLHQAMIHLLAITANPTVRHVALTRYDFGRIHKLFDNEGDVASKIEGFYQN